MKCSRCGREILDAGTLAAQAQAVRRLITGAIELGQGGAGLERTYGGSHGLRRALEEQLIKTERLAGAHARAVACLAGSCVVPPANDPMNMGTAS